MSCSDDHYLVVLNHMNDDIPLAMFTEDTLANQFAQHIDPRPEIHIQDVFGIDDRTTPICVSIVRFNMGIPVSRERVRHFE